MRLSVKRGDAINFKHSNCHIQITSTAYTDERNNNKELNVHSLDLVIFSQCQHIGDYTQF